MIPYIPPRSQEEQEKRDLERPIIFAVLALTLVFMLLLPLLTFTTTLVFFAVFFVTLVGMTKLIVARQNRVHRLRAGSNPHKYCSVCDSVIQQFKNMCPVCGARR